MTDGRDMKRLADQLTAVIPTFDGPSRSR